MAPGPARAYTAAATSRPPRPWRDDGHAPDHETGVRRPERGCGRGRDRSARLPGAAGLGVGAPTARAAGAVLAEAHYVFNSALLNVPDPPVWGKLGTLTPTPIANVGLHIADPDNQSQLLYTYEPSHLSSDPASPSFASEARMLAHLRIEPVPNASPAWSNEDAISATLILGWHDRVAMLLLVRHPVTLVRQLRFGGTVNPIDFGWDNGFENTYEIVRLPSGDYRLTATSGDGVSPTVVEPISSSQLRGSSGAFFFAWGSRLDGGGGASWREVHVEVRGACGSVASGILPPINADGSSNFQLGRTLPIRIRITDCKGLPLDALAPQLALVRIGAGAGAVNEVASSSAADSGTTMRSTGDGYYLFNLSTGRSQFNSGQDLSEGRYRLTISEPSLAAPVVAEFDLRP